MPAGYTYISGRLGAMVRLALLGVVLGSLFFRHTAHALARLFTRPIAAALSTSASNYNVVALLRNKVVTSIRMSLWAMSLAEVSANQCVAVFQVLARWHGFKVIWVYTGGCLTQVVDLKPRLDRPLRNLVSKTMWTVTSFQWASVPGKPPIAVGENVATPVPTIGGFLNSIPEFGDVVLHREISRLSKRRFAEARMHIKRVSILPKSDVVLVAETLRIDATKTCINCTLPMGLMSPFSHDHILPQVYV